MNLNCNCKAGDALRGNQIVEKKSQLIPAFVKNGWTVLWKCKVCGIYWESVFDGRYDERETLLCLSNEEADTKWHKCP